MSHSSLSPQNFLLMIENSSSLAFFWPDLRDCYLPRLVEQLSGSHPENLTNIFISESRSPSDFHVSGIRQCNSLKDGLNQVEFNYDLDNQLSTTQIQAAVEFLSSPALTSSQVRHLIVVAATPPTEFVNRSLHDPWYELANMIIQGDIHLHLALTSNLRSGSLPNLFEQTLKWQHNIEEPLWLPKYSTAFIFRVSAQQTYSNAVLSETKSGPSNVCRGNPDAPRDLIPPDMYTTKSLDDVSSESPSLVSQLQQFHGLTKKKVYGAKPPRIPFVRDEPPVRDRYRGSPARLVIPPAFPPPEHNAPTLLARRARSRPTVDRALPSRRERNADPYAPRARYQPMSSPEGDSSDHSSYSASNRSLPPSPVAPLSAADNYAFAAAPSIGGQSIVPLEQPWAPTSDASHNAQTPFCAPFSSAQTLDLRGSIACQFPASQGSFQPAPDLAMMRFHANSCATLPMTLPSPPFLLSPLRSPTAHSPPSDSFAPTCGDSEHGFGAQRFQQPQDAYPFPVSAPLPPPAQRLPGLVDMPDAQQWGLPIMQPTPMLPISGPALHDRVHGLARAASASETLLQPRAIARRASPAAGVPCATASSASGSAFASSSSSLTGWAG